jgi:hypothetical protein
MRVWDEDALWGMTPAGWMIYHLGCNEEDEEGGE